MHEMIDEFLGRVPREIAGRYDSLARKAMELGWKPKQDKTKHLSLSFSSSKYGATVMRFTLDRDQPAFRLKFFAAKDYSAVYSLRIRADRNRADR